MILVLVLSACEAYRVQASLSRQHMDIYRHYVDQDAAISTLRRNLWEAGNEVRDFFIRTTPDQAAILRTQLDLLQKENARALKQLEHASPAGGLAPKLRRRLNEFWALADPLPVTMLGKRKDTQFGFLQKEIVPRRGELYAALVELAAADRERLQQSAKEFEDIRRRAAIRLLLILGFGIVLGLAVAVFSIRHAEMLQRHAAEHFAEVARAKRELEQLSARLLDAEEETRRRLSRELHDEIGQTLALLQIEVSNAQRMVPPQAASARETLGRAQEMARRTATTLHDLSVLLRPPMLDDLGLTPALQFQLEDFLRRSGIECDFVEDGVAGQLPDAVKTCVYRVVQEALHNCEKHSGASRVRVAVRQVAGCLTVEVEDNGRGFTTERANAGLGLLGIRERVASVGGTLTVDSSAGQGVRLALRIPLASSVAEVTA
jgi:signal transduction histidine kinase